MPFIRGALTGTFVFLFAGLGHASTLEDWLAWRLQDHQRELEQQLGVEFGDEVGLDDLLLRGSEGWIPGEIIDPPGELVLRRTVAPPRIGVAASVREGPAPGWQLTLTLTFRTHRVVYQRVRPPGRYVAPVVLPERSGVAVLDHLLWRLAVAERQARCGEVLP